MCFFSFFVVVFCPHSQDMLDTSSPAVTRNTITYVRDIMKRQNGKVDFASLGSAAGTIETLRIADCERIMGAKKDTKAKSRAPVYSNDSGKQKRRGRKA